MSGGDPCPSIESSVSRQRSRPPRRNPGAPPMPGHALAGLVGARHTFAISDTLAPQGALIVGRDELTETHAGDHHPEHGAHVEGTSAMDGFDHILNWKLKAGSHP